MLTKVILTQKMVDQLRVPGVLTCPSCKGLRMEATISQSTGRLRKIWTYRYRARTGALRQIKLGEFPGMNVDAAKAASSTAEASATSRALQSETPPALSSIKPTSVMDGLLLRR
jgi:hypothetical protein